MKTNKRGSFDAILGTVVFLVIIAMVTCKLFLNYGHREIVSEKIVDANIEMVGGGQTLSREKYLFTEDNTYLIQDRFWIGATRSMDVYREAKANVGKTCEIESIGTRVGFFSMYKSAISINCD